MRLMTRDQAKKIDELSQTKYGLSAEVLMEAAGVAAFREILAICLPELHQGRCLVMVGRGHNGADALVLARHLHSAGFRNVAIYVVDFESNSKGNARGELFKSQLLRSKKQGVKQIQKRETLEEYGAGATLIVDGLYGIGLNRDLSASDKSLIELINQFSKVPSSARSPTVVSLDIPSGLNPDTGETYGACVKAKFTLTFGGAKPGCFTGQGPSACGIVRILSLGFPRHLVRRQAGTHFLFNERLARRFLPERKECSNKSDHGHLLVLAGKPGMMGAGLLATTAAYRVGAGYVTLASKDSVVPSGENLDILMASTKDPNLFAKKTAVVIGPGLGVDDQTKQLLIKLKSLSGEAGDPNGIRGVVVDADALTVCCNHNLWPLPSHWILTPHEGELQRIIGQPISDRFQAAARAAKKAGCWVLLKGFRSILTNGEKFFVIAAGNRALAKAGTGDVLAGMIGGFIAQQVLPAAAAALGAYVHGRVADEWVQTGDANSLMASDLRDKLPGVLMQIRQPQGFWGV